MHVGPGKDEASSLIPAIWTQSGSSEAPRAPQHHERLPSWTWETGQLGSQHPKPVMPFDPQFRGAGFLH